ncbi:MAG: LysE family translocator [Anaerolineae bacterium]
MALLAQGIGFGYAAGVTPGPLQLFLVTQTLQFGWRHGIWLILAPLISDGPIVALVLLVLRQASDDLLRVIALVGGAFVLYIAWGLWGHLRRGMLEIVPEGVPVTDAAAGRWEAVRRAAAINALGPGPWLFWGTAMGPMVIAAWREAPLSAVLFVAGFYGAFLAVMAAQVVLVHQARRLGTRAVRAALWIGLVALLVFALRLWGQALAGL